MSYGLAGYWPMLECGGNIINDLSGNGNYGILSGTTKPTWVAGPDGNCLSFDGTSSYISCGTKLVISGYKLTVAAFVKHPSASGDELPHRIVSKYNDSAWSNMCFYLSMRASTPNYCGFEFQVPTTGDYTTTGTGWIDSTEFYNKWVHVVGVYDSAYLRLYLNGRERTTPTAKTVAITPASSIDLCIGRTVKESGIPRYMRGNISNVMISNNALTASEVQYLYMKQRCLIEGCD